MERRLAAVLIADVVGYSRLMEADESGTLAAWKERNSTIVEPTVAKHRGRVVKGMGDGVLVEFASAVNAVAAALEIQGGMGLANADLPDADRIVVRIGINLGDLIGEGPDIYGGGVNVAARLESIAEPGGICISAKVHEEVQGKLEYVFEDMGEQAMKNIARPIRAYRISHGKPATRQVQPTSGLRDRTVIAVLPFDNLSGDPSQQYLSDGITEDIITELSRFRSVSVLGRHVAFRLGGMGADPIQGARSLGADFVVEGSVRRAGDRIRITAQLIDARNGNHVWADRYDRESSDIFSVQDEVVRATVATLEGRMVAAAAVNARRRPTTSWTAYDFFLRGRELSDASLEREATPFFTESVRVDPDFALAHAWLAMALLGSYWSDADVRTLDQAAHAAQRALELDSNDATVHHANAMVRLWLRQLNRSMLHFERSISLNPLDAQVRADRANLLRYSGRLQEALLAIDEELHRTPYPPLWFWRVRGGILLELQRYSEAIDALSNIPQKDQFTLLQLAAAHAYLGDNLAASEILANARLLRPGISIAEVAIVVPYAQNEQLEHLLVGLRKAGLE